MTSAAGVRPRMLGRFELRRVLGEGGQATVWLGYDARLEREVAVKLLNIDTAVDAAADAAGGSDPAAIDQWLQEARSVSRLTHPHIVPVFEADLHRGQPYLVFEYVPGPTLAQHLKARGALPAHEAVALMLGVLDALAAAHASGVVHRDLKPSNILIDASGRARVMDFGIAARLLDATSAPQVVGTPGYMSPEAASGGRPTGAMDVFSAGLVLIEMLTGRRLIAERDPHRAIERAAGEDLALPDGLPAAVDDPLRALLMRAIARDPAARWADALAMRVALHGWLIPASDAAAAADAAAGTGAATGAANGTLDFLLRRMRHKSDFPALSDSVARIQRLASSENETLSSLSNEILKDVALTNKLLRLVNTANFSNAGGGSVSTVSRAVALVGMAGIRNLATSLVLLEHMHDKAHANQLKEQFLRSLMAGTLASELASDAKVGEEAFIGAMFQNLGRLLTEYYFPEEASQVRALLAAGDKGGPAGALVNETSASRNVLGVSFEELGLGVARSWKLPASLQGCMRKPAGEPPPRPPPQTADQLRWLASAANQITDTLLLSEPEAAPARLGAAARRHAGVLGISAAGIEAAAAVARERLAQMAQAMNLQFAPHSPARRLLAPSAPLSTEAVTAAAAATGDAPTPQQEQEAVTVRQARPASALDNASEVLAAGIQDIANSMVEDFKLNEVLRMILETMLRALDFQRIVFCLRDARTGMLTGRFGLGDKAAATAAHFRIPLVNANAIGSGTGADLFGTICVKGADTLISDATAPNIAARLPAWYRQSVNAPAFLLLPMLMKGAPFALIYADKARPGGIELGEKELSLLRTLRNQAVMAFKQAG